MSTPTDPPADDAEALDAAESLRLIAESQRRARTGTLPDGRLLYLVWGLAWGIGYSVLWTSSRTTGSPPTGPAFAVFFVCIAAAVAFTIVHSVTRAAGTRGRSARVGAMYGWAWTLGFVSYPLIVAGIADAGASPEIIALLANALACLVVGMMYLAGGACFADLRLYLLGVWILLVGGAATLAGIPGTYLVLAGAGGGGFLLMGLVETLLRARRRSVAGGRRG
ncbi:hypothetical protein ATJ88_3422 [Isoptericola jiangsuensis]|uniref:Uncharacterized protein n=1 Tax=Isoptericola jiangsuensis TaxID=548579 RepID=A0A2A9F1J4_9MICO|nr:hypothetical protein [Isoptericola jiangsuensis]PFG44686.1 hypothetical protein ATJ88_3422 [Isoptericola jiangsuensis]